MADLDKRLKRLEEYQADTTPDPVPVCISDDPEVIAAFEKVHPGGVIIRAVCFRECTEDCPDQGGHSCRQARGAQ